MCNTLSSTTRPGPELTERYVVDERFLVWSTHDRERIVAGAFHPKLKRAAENDPAGTKLLRQKCFSLYLDGLAIKIGRST
jgi:hypothetical protein